MPYELIIAAAGLFLMGLIVGLAWKGRQLHRETLIRNAAESEVRRLTTVESECREKEARLSRSQRELAQLRAQRDNESKAHQEKMAILEEARKRLADTFKSLSTDIFTDNSQRFLNLASERLDHYRRGLEDNMKSQRQEVTGLLSPIRDSLRRFSEQTRESERLRQTEHDTLMRRTQSMLETNQRIGDEAANLARAMDGDTPVTGHWGNMQLRRVVEMTGMTSYCDLHPGDATTATATATDAEPSAPDLTVRLPGDKRVLVDAKAPLRAYRLAVMEKNDDKRAELSREYSKSVRRHMDTLSKRPYSRSTDPTTVFVVLYLPGEPLYMEALRSDPELLAYGAEKRVLLAGPTTLVAMLHMIAFSWRDRGAAEHADKIRDRGVELYRQLVSLSGHWTAVGRGLRALVGDYNDAVAAMETRVMDKARGFQDLLPEESKPTDSGIPHTPSVQTTPRTPRIGDTPRTFPADGSTRTPHAADGAPPAEAEAREGETSLSKPLEDGGGRT